MVPHLIGAESAGALPHAAASFTPAPRADVLRIVQNKDPVTAIRGRLFNLWFERLVFPILTIVRPFDRSR